DRGSRDRAVFASCRARTLLRRARLRGSGAARAWLRDPDALRPLADGAADARARRRACAAKTHRPRPARARRGREDLPRGRRPSRTRLRLASLRPAGGAGLRGDLRRRGRDYLSPLRQALARRRLGQPAAAGRPAPPNREPRLELPARCTPARRLDRPPQPEPRLAEPGRVARERSRCDPERRPSAGRDCAVDRVRPRTGDAGAARPLLGRERGCVHRLRQGALAAVPDLVAATRPACPRAARVRRLGCARRGTCVDAALIPVPLLAPGAAPGLDRLLARLRTRPRARRARLRAGYTSTRTGSQLVARPSAPHSTKAPSIRTPPSAGLKRTGMPVRMRAIARSAWTPITESCGPVMPASLI